MKSWFTIQNKADTEPVEILIYDQIGKDWFSGDGIAAKDFAEALKEIPKDRQIVVGINSPGGNVWDGLAIYHQLRARGDKVTTRIDGIAASIASVIALAGYLVQMPKNALMMIHRAWGMAIGNAADMLKLADDLAKHDGVIAGIYSDKNGKSDAENLQAMEAETWFNGEEASAFGLVDEVTDTVAMAANFDLSRFKHAPNSGVPVGPSAQTQQTRIQVMDNTPPAPAVTPTAAPAIDLQPVIAAIEGLKDSLKPVTPPGAAPLGAQIEVVGNPLVERYNNLAHDKVGQGKFAKGLYSEVRKQLLIAAGVKDLPRKYDMFDFNTPNIRNANTVDSALANTVLSSEFVTTMRTYIAPWSAFTRRVELSPISRRQTLEVPLVSTAGSKQQNATNYETGDSTLAPIAVVVDEESRSFHINRPQANLGLQLASLVPTNAKVLAEGIHAKMTALMVSGNFGAAIAIGAAASFDTGDLPAILALGKNYDRVNLLLDGGHLAYLLPVNTFAYQYTESGTPGLPGGAFGFDGIWKNNLWTSAEANTVGFICGPDAIVNGWGMADGLPSGEFISQSTVDVNGIPFGLSVWFSRATRFVWGSFQVMHGCAKGDTTQAEILVTS